MSIYLSEEQQKVIEVLDGPILVKAGPGSGKTRVVIEKIKHILFNRPGDKILAITFSNMAANEMRERLESDDEISDSILNYVNVNTIHSFCLDLFSSYSYLIGVDSDITIIDSDSEKLKIIKNLIVNNQFDTNYEADLNQYASKMLKEISSIKRDLKSGREIEDANLREIFDLYNFELLRQNCLDFDDILYYSYKILSEYPNVCNIYSKMYNYVFVDEAQDLNYSQYVIINTLFSDKNTNICFVGDSNQSIYGFNGSSSKYMTKYFVDYYNPAIFELTKNFRSARLIVDFANNFKNTKSSLDCYYDGVMKAYAFDDERAESEYIVKSIKFLLQNGYKDIEHVLTYSDFAIIGRNRYSLDKVTDSLVDAGIPVFIKKNTSGIALDSYIMQLFDLCVRLVNNEKDKLHADELISYLKLDYQSNDWRKAISSSKLSFLLEIANKMHENGFNIDYYFDLLKDKINKNDSFVNDDKYVAIQDIEEYKKHWDRFCRITLSQGRNLLNFRNAISLGKTAETSEKNGVNIISAHMSKGLQFDVVFIVGMTEGSFPDYRAIKGEKENLEQEKNNMYVAVTRAKRICILTYPLIRRNSYGSFKQKQSQFLDGIKVQRK